MFNNYYPYNNPKRNNILSNLKSFKWSSFLDGTQKTLSIINQTIPIIYQIKPIYQNAKAAFKVVNAFKDEVKVKENEIKKESIRPITFNNSPTYFL